MTKICDCRPSEMRIALPSEAYDKKSRRGLAAMGSGAEHVRAGRLAARGEGFQRAASARVQGPERG
jgi:hypothetical protein